MAIHKEISYGEAFYAALEVKQSSWHSMDITFIENLILIIKSNINDDEFNAVVLAQKSFISVSQLNRRLKKLLNISSASLIRRLRMDYAITLLTKEGFSIQRTAFEVGYKNQANFCRCFKKTCGFVPSTLLKKYKNI